MLDVTALHVPKEACEGPIIKVTRDSGVHVLGKMCCKYDCHLCF